MFKKMYRNLIEVTQKMEKEIIEKQLKQAVISFLNDVEDNRVYDYEGLIKVILNYQSLQKKEVIKIMRAIDQEFRKDFSDTQEEIMIEVITSLQGSPFGRIDIKWGED